MHDTSFGREILLDKKFFFILLHFQNFLQILYFLSFTLKWDSVSYHLNDLKGTRFLCQLLMFSQTCKPVFRYFWMWWCIAECFLAFRKLCCYLHFQGLRVLESRNLVEKGENFPQNFVNHLLIDAAWNPRKPKSSMHF